MAVTLYNAYDPSSTTWDNGYRLRLLVEQQSYDAASNSSQVRFRMWLDGNGTQWFDGWAVTLNVDYAAYNAAGTKGTTVAVANSPSGNQTQGSPGANKLWVDQTKTIVHDENGVLRLGVHGDFKTNVAPSTTYPYLVPPMSLGSVNSINTTTVNEIVTPSTPTGLSVTRGAVNIDSNLQTFTVVGSGSTSPSGGSVSYYYSYSTDGSSWSAETTSTSITITATQKYYFRVRAYQDAYSGYYTPGTLYTGYPEAISSISLSRGTAYPDGNKITLSWTKPTTTVSGTTVNSYYRAYAFSSDSGATWTPWSAEATVSDAATNVSSLVSVTVGRLYRFYVKPVDGSGRTGSATYSGNIYVPSLPTTPTLSTPVKNVRQVSLTWTASSFNTATVNKYEVSSRYSGDNGSNWSDWSVMSDSLTTTSYTTDNLNIAKLYEFRVRAQSEVGYSTTYATSSRIFISAYGYRMNSVSGVPTAKAIELAARYTGSPSDSVIVGATTYPGWKQIESMKRYTGTAFIDFVQ